MDHETEYKTKCRVKKEVLNKSLMKDAISKSIANIKKEINELNKDELMSRMKYFCLDSDSGEDDVALKERLIENYKRIKSSNVAVYVSSTLLPFYVIIDFEATCTEDPKDQSCFLPEIIEFAAVLVNARSLEIIDDFQMYCKPILNPKLSDFCIKLTGITQELVDSANPFTTSLDCFVQWLNEHGLSNKKKFAIVTDSPWDMSRYLFNQCHFSDIPYPNWGERWVNIKRLFCNFYKCKNLPLKATLNELGMEFEGRLHCGLDDARNIARLLVRMIADGAEIRANEKILKKRLRGDWSSVNIFDASINSSDNHDKQKRNVTKLGAQFIILKHPKDLSLTYEIVQKERQRSKRKLKNEFGVEWDDADDGLKIDLVFPVSNQSKRHKRKQSQKKKHKNSNKS